MDDMDDDARYPPNPYPSNPRRPYLHPHSTSSAPHRSRPSRRSPLAPPLDHLPRRYPSEEDDDNMHHQPLDDDDDDDDDDDQEEDDDDAGGDHPIQGGGGGGGEDGDDDSSLESRGKRRRIDKFAHPRLPPPAAAVAPSKIPTPARSSPADWSEDSTFVLLEAWGDRYVQNGRKSLRSEEWNEVSKIVSQSSRFSRSDAQCRNRVDTLKKKYKKEKAKIGEHGNLSSTWVYFKKMDALMSVPSLPPYVGQRQQQLQPPRLPCGVDAGEYVFADSTFHHRIGNDEMRDSPGDTETDDDGEDDEGDEDDSDGLPPRSNDASMSSGSSFRMLADSIQKFGKIYEKMENNKRQQMAELERMRKDFQRDLEVQKRQILERAQAEIARIREEVEYEEEDRLDEDEDDDDNDDDNAGGGGSAENISGFLFGSLYLTAFG